MALNARRMLSLGCGRWLLVMTTYDHRQLVQDLPWCILLQRSGNQETAEHSLLHSQTVDSIVVEEAPFQLPSKEHGEQLFQRIDCNGNGALCLAEIDKAVIELWPQFNH